MSFRRLQPRIVLAIVAILITTGIASWTVAPSSAQSGERLAGQESDRGSRIPIRQEISEAEMIGPVEEEASFDLVLSLKLRNREELDQFVSSLHDPNSTNFQNWLTPEQFGERFGVSQQDYLQMTRWLAENGFEVTGEWASRAQINFRGTAGRIRSAFHTQLNKYRMADKIHFANSTSPLLPPQFDNLVEYIDGLEDFSQLKPAHKIESKFQSNGRVGVAPKDIHRAYNLESLISSGNDGSNQKIGIVARSNFKTKDIKLFRSEFGLPPIQLKKIFPFGLIANRGGGEETEVLLDTQWAGAVAPAATVVVVIARDVDISLQYFVNSMPDVKIISISFGLCEERLGEDRVKMFHDLYTQAAAQGQTVFVSSGDDGANDCGDGFGQQVNGLASSPNCVAVGGTRLDPVFDKNGDATEFGDETVWRGGGGGASIIFKKPAYQQGVEDLAAEKGRALPDVAALADPSGPGAWIAQRAKTTCCIGGTSLAAPIWAGFLALVNQKTGPQGNFNNRLYSMGSEQFSKTIPSAFNDTVKGNNTFHGVTGFSALPGHDRATGWGSFNGQNFIDSLK